MNTDLHRTQGLSTAVSTPTAPARRAARLSTLVLAAGMLFASGCGLPFPDNGEDISADVAVGGTKTESSAERATESTIPVLDDRTLEDTTEPTLADPTQDATAPSEPAPSVAIDTRFDGRSMRYLGIDIELGDFITTNQTLEEYLGSLPPTDDTQTLLVEVSITNGSSGTVSVPSDVLGLRLASGEWVPVDEMRETDGDRLTTVQPATQATERVVLEFPTVDLVGASFEVSEASTIAESIPLTAEETTAGSYLIELPGQLPVADLESPSLWPSCGYLWTGEVLSGSVTVEGVDGRRLERATKGQRWIAIEMRVEYEATSVTGSSPCDDYGVAVNEVDPRLVIDGVAASSLNSVAGDRIATGTAVTVEYWFQIPVEASEIELTDVGGTRIAIWNLDLPRLEGES